MLDWQRIAESIIGLTTASLLVKLCETINDKLYKHRVTDEQPDVPLSTHIQNHYMLPVTPINKFIYHYRLGTQPPYNHRVDASSFFNTSYIPDIALGSDDSS